VDENLTAKSVRRTISPAAIPPADISTMDVPQLTHAARPLGPKAKRFIAERLLDHNRAQAALPAGYALSQSVDEGWRW
jgi:hypothetical protein